MPENTSGTSDWTSFTAAGDSNTGQIANWDAAIHNFLGSDSDSANAQMGGQILGSVGSLFGSTIGGWATGLGNLIGGWIPGDKTEEATNQWKQQALSEIATEANKPYGLMQELMVFDTAKSGNNFETVIDWWRGRPDRVQNTLKDWINEHLAEGVSLVAQMANLPAADVLNMLKWEVKRSGNPATQVVEWWSRDVKNIQDTDRGYKAYLAAQPKTQSAAPQAQAAASAPQYSTPTRSSSAGPAPAPPQANTTTSTPSGPKESQTTTYALAGGGALLVLLILFLVLKK